MRTQQIATDFYHRTAVAEVEIDEKAVNRPQFGDGRSMGSITNEFGVRLGFDCFYMFVVSCAGIAVALGQLLIAADHPLNSDGLRGRGIIALQPYFDAFASS